MTERSDLVAGIAEVASTAYQGISSIVAAITPSRPGATEPRRNIAREQTGENAMEAQSNSNSGNRGGRMGSGGD